MPSTFPSTVQPVDEDQSMSAVLRWRTWPLVDRARWSWILVIGIGAVGGIVAYLGQSWLLALGATIGLATTLWQFLVPVRYEIGGLGLRLIVFGRSRFVPWRAIQAYQLRTSGILLYRHPDPSKADLLRSLFVPYPADEDDTICAFRQHLSHAVELPN